MDKILITKTIKVTMFRKETWDKLHEISLDDDIFDEVCWILKYIHPRVRVQYLDDVFYGIK